MAVVKLPTASDARRSVAPTVSETRPLSELHASCGPDRTYRRLSMEKSFKRRARARLTQLLIAPTGGLADRGCLLVGEARRADEKKSLTLVARQLCKPHAKFLEFDPLSLLGRRYSDRNWLRKMVNSQADLLPWLERIDVDYGTERFPHEVIRRSNLQLSEIANARRCGTAASMASRTAGDTASRTAGEASSVRSFVVRIVERVVVALGRDTDAATIFTCVP
jgi:hypothetical protein